MPIVDQVRDLVYQSPGLSLSELAPLALLDRMDTKFVLHQDQLCAILSEVIHEYRVLEINGVRPGRYVTTYFDTPAFAMYFAHHNGARDRYKLRCRSYLDSRMVFVEVKMKNNKNRMRKYRRQVPEHVTQMSAIDRSWLPPSFPYALDDVQAVAWNRFHRVTLANFALQERLTIDVDIYFGCGERQIQYEGLCVVEVKQSEFSMRRSPFARQLHKMHLQPLSISKFCVATASFYPSFRHNHFKPLLLHLSRHFPPRGTCERFI